MEITVMNEMSVELFERIAEIRKQEEPIKYMVGVKLTDGRNCYFHTVKYIDCDIATGEMIGFSENEESIRIERIPREMVLYRV